MDLLEGKVYKDAAAGIRYIKIGRGEKTMVVVPGLTIGYVTDNADALMEACAPFADDFTVWVFDIREDVPEGYTIRDMGDDLASAIKTLGLEHVHLYGCSMGGMESIYIAGTYPELIEKLVVSSTACRANETTNRVFSNWIRLAKEGKCRELTADMGQKIYSEPVFEASRPVFEAMADGLNGEMLGRFVNTTAVMLDIDLSEEAAAIKCPVFVFGAYGDKVMTGEATLQIADITGAQVYMFGRECSHAIYDEVPELKVKARDFFCS